MAKRPAVPKAAGRAAEQAAVRPRSRHSGRRHEIPADDSTVAGAAVSWVHAAALRVETRLVSVDTVVQRLEDRLRVGGGGRGDDGMGRRLRLMLEEGHTKVKEFIRGSGQTGPRYAWPRTSAAPAGKWAWGLNGSMLTLDDMADVVREGVEGGI